MSVCFIKSSQWTFLPSGLIKENVTDSQNSWGWKGLLEVIKRRASSRLPMTMSRQLLDISMVEDSTTSMSKLCQCSVTITVKLFPDVQREPPVFQAVLTASGSVTGHHWKEPGSVCFTPSLQVFIYIDKIPTEPSLLQAEQFQLSQPFLIGEMLQTLIHLCDPSLDSHQYINASLVLGSPELDKHSRCGLTSAEQRGRITSLNLVATLCLKQLRIPFASFAARAHCWLVLNKEKLLSSWVAPSIHWCVKHTYEAHRDGDIGKIVLSWMRNKGSEKGGGLWQAEVGGWALSGVDCLSGDCGRHCNAILYQHPPKPLKLCLIKASYLTGKMN